jgi:hypothetical protein
MAFIQPQPLRLVGVGGRRRNLICGRHVLPPGRRGDCIAQRARQRITAATPPGHKINQGRRAQSVTSTVREIGLVSIANSPGLLICSEMVADPWCHSQNSSTILPHPPSNACYKSKAVVIPGILWPNRIATIPTIC